MWAAAVDVVAVVDIVVASSRTAGQRPRGKKTFALSTDWNIPPLLQATDKLLEAWIMTSWRKISDEVEKREGGGSLFIVQDGKMVILAPASGVGSVRSSIGPLGGIEPLTGRDR